MMFGKEPSGFPGICGIFGDGRGGNPSGFGGFKGGESETRGRLAEFRQLIGFEARHILSEPRNHHRQNDRYRGQHFPHFLPLRFGRFFRRGFGLVLVHDDSFSALVEIGAYGQL